MRHACLMLPLFAACTAVEGPCNVPAHGDVQCGEGGHALFLRSDTVADIAHTLAPALLPMLLPPTQGPGKATSQ